MVRYGLALFSPWDDSPRLQGGGALRRQPHRTLASLIVVLVIGLTINPGASAASGDGKPELYRGFYVELGGFAPLDVKTTLGVSIPEFELDEEIDLDTQIDLDRILVSNVEVDRSRFRGGYRFSRRHEFEFSYLSVTRENEVMFAESFQYLNQDFTAGIDVRTILKTEDLEIGYKYFIVVAPRGEFGFSLGIHVVQTEFSIDAEAFVTPEFPDLIDLSLSESDSLDVPLPYLGLFFDVKIGERFYFGALGKILDIEIDDYAGNWYTFEVSLEHWTFKHVGFGVGYYFNRLDVTRDRVEVFAIDALELEQSGIQAYVRFNT